MGKSFTAAVKEYFGVRPEESRIKGDDGKPVSGLVDFSAELKKLILADRVEIASGLRSIGYECDDPLAPAVPSAG